MKVSIQLLVLFVSLQLASVINAASIPVASPEESHNLSKRDADAGHYGYNNHGYGYRNNYNYGRNNYHNRHNYGNRRNSNADALALGVLGGIKGAILAPAILAGKAAFLGALPFIGK